MGSVRHASGTRTMPDPASFERPWLQAYPPGVPPTYDYPDVPLTRFLDDAARDFPGVVATWYGGAKLTYAQLLDLVDRCAGAFAELGISQGSRVAVALGNLPAFPIVFFAAHRLGAVVVPVQPDLDEHMLQSRLEDSAANLVVCHTGAVDRVRAVRRRLGRNVRVVTTGHVHWLPAWRRALTPPGRRWRYRRVSREEAVLTLPELLDTSEPHPTQAPVEGQDLAVLAYARRSAGETVGIMLSHAGLVANSFQSRLWVPDTQAGNERVLAAVPFTHMYGLTVGMLTGVLSAATLVLAPRFDADTAFWLIENRRPTLFPAVPSMLATIADHPGAGNTDLGSLRACLSGGAPLPDVVAERLETLSGARVRQGYGVTEAGPLTHANPIYGRSVPSTIGLPVTDTVAAIVDPDNPSTVLEPGRTGQLAVHGPQLMIGYWRRPDITARRLVDGWLLTTDRATVGEDGYFELASTLPEVSR